MMKVRGSTKLEAFSTFLVEDGLVDDQQQPPEGAAAAGNGDGDGDDEVADLD